MIQNKPTHCVLCHRPEMCNDFRRCLQPPAAPATADAIQIGGDHYKGFGNYQPWTVFEHWYPTEEVLAYLMMSAIAYLPRERHKGGVQDVEKAIHTLQKWVEVRKANPVKNQ